MPYGVFIEPRAIADIQQAVDYYDKQQRGLGKKFMLVIDNHLSVFCKNPFFQIRYEGIRCLPVKRFPFMIHFIVDQENKEVFIISVFHTSQRPPHSLT